MDNGYVENMWAIHRDGIGLYIGTWNTRKEAIANHCNAKYVIPCDLYPSIQSAWKECKRLGDKAVKVEIKYVV